MDTTTTTAIKHVLEENYFLINLQKMRLDYEINLTNKSVWIVTIEFFCFSNPYVKQIRNFLNLCLNYTRVQN